MGGDIEDFVEGQKDKLRSYCLKGFKLNLATRTKYFSQRDNYTMPHRTCNSSANAMWLDWVMRATGRSGLSGDDRYLKMVLGIGDTIQHWAQTGAIKNYGFASEWRENKNLAIAEGLVTAGIPVVVNIAHRGTAEAPKGGHVILLCGRRGDSWVAQDPYGSLDSGYSDTDGEHDLISGSEFKARWQGGYRVLS